jgi:hypothetical protein
MKINIITIYYALGIALLAASIHEVSTNKHFEADDFQIDEDQEVEAVSCFLLVDAPILRLVYHSFLHHVLTFSCFHYDPTSCTR